MSRRPNLDSIVKRLDEGKDFFITRVDYIKETGVDIPQDRRYTENRSAIAKKAHERGYSIKVVPEVLCFEKNKF